LATAQSSVQDLSFQVRELNFEIESLKRQAEIEETDKQKIIKERNELREKTQIGAKSLQDY